MLEFYVGLGFEQFSSFALQDRILVLHESSFICPLLKMKPKSSVLPIPLLAETSADDANQTTTSTGLALGETRIIIPALSVLFTLSILHRIRLSHSRRARRFCRLLPRHQTSRAARNPPQSNQVPFKIVASSVFPGKLLTISWLRGCQHVELIHAKWGKKLGISNKLQRKTRRQLLAN